MKKKKILALGMAAVMAFSCLTGCGNEGNSDSGSSSPATGQQQPSGGSAEGGFIYTGEAPITDQPATLKILAQTSNYTTVDIANAEIVKTVVANAGITVDWQLIDFNSYAQSVGPMLGTGQVDADIALLPDQDPTQTYIKSGLFTPLDEYFSEMPNFTKWLDENPVVKAEITAEDGHIYYMPAMNVAKDYGPCIMYNQPWLKKAGKESPKTLDELVELLRYYRDNDMNGNGDASDEIPLSVMSAFLPYMFGPAFGINLVSGFAADEDGDVSYAPADPEKYKNYLTFLKGLYDEGLLEVEYTSLDRDQITERVSNDLTGVTFDYSWSQSMIFSPVLPGYDGTAETAIVGGAPLSGEYEGFLVGGTGLGNMFGVLAKSSNPVLACRFLDYAMSAPCQEMYQWGIEGVSYTVAADGTRSYTEQAADNDWLQQLGINPAFVFPAQQSVIATDVLVAPWHAENNAWQRQFVIDPWPFVYSTSDEAEIIDTYMVDIQTSVDENATKFINGTRSLDEYDTYLSELENLHLADVLKVKQAQYQRYLAALQGN